MLLVWPSLLSYGLTLASVAILLAAAVHDVIARTAPNWMAITLAVLGIASRILHGSILYGFGVRAAEFVLIGFAAAAAVFVLAAICWRRGWLGGGDVKLLGAAALVVPPGDVPGFLSAVALAGAALALVYLLARRVTATPAPQRPDHLFARAVRVERWRIHRGGPLPYAFAIAAGFLFVVL
jgi:prepilin peptidase CpaA